MMGTAGAFEPQFQLPERDGVGCVDADRRLQHDLDAAPGGGIDDRPEQAELVEITGRRHRIDTVDAFQCWLQAARVGKVQPHGLGAGGQSGRGAAARGLHALALAEKFGHQRRADIAGGGQNQDFSLGHIKLLSAFFLKAGFKRKLVSGRISG